MAARYDLVSSIIDRIGNPLVGRRGEYSCLNISTRTSILPSGTPFAEGLRALSVQSSFGPDICRPVCAPPTIAIDF